MGLDLTAAMLARVPARADLALVLDKFVRPGERAPLRRALNVFARRVATRLDVVLEQALRAAPAFAVESDEPVLAHGWFRSIVLEKRATSGSSTTR